MIVVGEHVATSIKILLYEKESGKRTAILFLFIFILLFIYFMALALWPCLCFVFVSFDYNRVLKHFFWSGMKADVAHYYKTCHNCQIV